MTSEHWSLLLYAAFAVGALIFLIARLKLNAFVALILASLFIGLCAGLELPQIGKAFQEGVGGVLSSIAIIIGLGTILGKMLAESGGAEVLARRLAGIFGEKRVHWAVALIAFIVGFPVWFTVGLVLLIPIIFTLAREMKTPLLFLGVPMLAGLSVSHGLVPPHPGPLAAIGIFEADLGKTIFYSLLVGFPTVLIVGPWFGKFIAPRVPVPLGELGLQLSQRNARTQPPGLALTLFTILLPIALMLLATLAEVLLAKNSAALAVVQFIGSPLVAMLTGVLFSFYAFGFARGFNRQQILGFSEQCLAPVALVLLVVGSGGGFSRVLVASGVGDALAALLHDRAMSPLLLGWLVAASIRIATGSATVAITTAAGIVVAYARSAGANMELLVIATGAGSLILSHLNDGGFWFVKEYFNMTVTQTLKTWTVLETIISVVALALVMLLNLTGL